MKFSAVLLTAAVFAQSVFAGYQPPSYDTKTVTVTDYKYKTKTEYKKIYVTKTETETKYVPKWKTTTVIKKVPYPVTTTVTTTKKVPYPVYTTKTVTKYVPKTYWKTKTTTEYKKIYITKWKEPVTKTVTKVITTPGPTTTVYKWKTVYKTVTKDCYQPPKYDY